MTEIEYLRGDRAEVIVCRGSMLSYPQHNHVSTLTLGLVLEGAVELATDRGTRLCRENGLFALPPYTPHRFQLQNRVRKGQRLLAGPATVAEAAAAGFCDQSHFDRQFKRLVGLNPAAYKRCCAVFAGP